MILGNTKPISPFSIWYSSCPTPNSKAPSVTHTISKALCKCGDTCLATLFTARISSSVSTNDKCTDKFLLSLAHNSALSPYIYCKIWLFFLFFWQAILFLLSYNKHITKNKEEGKMSKLKQYFNILLTFYADYFNHIYRA